MDGRAAPNQIDILKRIMPEFMSERSHSLTSSTLGWKMVWFRMAVTARTYGHLFGYAKTSSCPTKFSDIDAMKAWHPAFHSPFSLSDPLLIRSALESLTSDDIPMWTTMFSVELY